jgi:hypothetical protein
MTDYVKSTNFASKDSLATGNPLKIVKGTEIDSEFNNIATAVATKADSASPLLTGVPLAPTASTGTNTTQVATTAFVKNAVDAYDAALTVSTTQIETGAVTAVKLAAGVAESNLGFTPVQQGGGTGQLANKTYIGWSGSKLKAQVDSSDQGAFVMEPSFTGSNQSLSGSGYQKLPGGLIIQWGSFSQTGSSTTVTLPIAFPNAMLNVQQTIAGGASISAPGVSFVNSQQFNSIRDAAVGNVGCYYLAIGY